MMRCDAAAAAVDDMIVGRDEGVTKAILGTISIGYKKEKTTNGGGKVL